MRAVESDPRPALVARGVSGQIADAVRTPPNGSVEIRLSPEELGRVTLSMVPGDAGLVVQLVAERPETLELMRRHVDLLAADLLELGYSGLEFSFSQEDRPQPGHDDAPVSRPRPPEPDGSPTLAAPSARTGRLAPDGSLDIRL